MERRKRQALSLGRLPSDTRKGAAAMPVTCSCTVLLLLDQTDVNHLEDAIV